MISEASLLDAFRSALDSKALVRTRRPGTLFQIELPAFMADGDGAQVFVRTTGTPKVTLTDLGSTRMRMSFDAKVTTEAEQELERMASDHGLRFVGGELCVDVAPQDLFAATLGLIQVESQAERIVRATHRRSHEKAEFRATVEALLGNLFGTQVESPYFDKKTDPQGEYPVFALVHTPVELAVAVVTSDLEAERAIVAKMKLFSRTKKARWVVITKDFERLTSKTRAHLVKEYHLACSTFDPDLVTQKLRDLSS